jgi:hypothetical protein
VSDIISSNYGNPGMGSCGDMLILLCLIVLLFSLYICLDGMTTLGMTLDLVNELQSLDFGKVVVVIDCQ